jgi:hypothetical protein
LTTTRLLSVTNTLPAGQTNGLNSGATLGKTFGTMTQNPNQTNAAMSINFAKVRMMKASPSL